MTRRSPCFDVNAFAFEARRARMHAPQGVAVMNKRTDAFIVHAS